MAKTIKQPRKFYYGQVDKEYQTDNTAIKNNSLSYCRNVVSTSTGAIKPRPGFVFSKDLSGDAVLIPYRYNSQDLVLSFQDGTLDVLQDNGNGLDRFNATAPSLYLFPNTTSNVQDGVSLSDNRATSDIYRSYTGTITNIPEISIGQGANFLYETSMDFGENKSIQKMFVSVLDSLTGNSQDFSAQRWVDVFLQYSDDGITYTTISSTIESVNRRETTLSGIYPVNKALIITNFYESHRYWKLCIRLDTTKIVNRTFYLYLTDSVYTQTQKLSETIETPYAVEDLQDLKYAQNGLEMTICSKNQTVLPQLFKVESGAPSLTEFNHVLFGQYGTPSCVCYFQERRWFSGFESYPTRVIASALGNYVDYAMPPLGEIISSSPLYVESSQLKNMITNLYGGTKALYALSHDGISMIDAGGSVVGTTQINFLLKNNQHISDITPTVKDNIMFLVSEDREKIYAIDFDLITDKFIAPEVSVYANEVLRDKVKEIHFIDTREQMIYGILDSGNAFALYFKSMQQPIGFFPITTSGTITDISSIRYGDRYFMYAVINRNSNYSVERLQQQPFFKRTEEFNVSVNKNNERTKQNLLDTLYFDKAKSVANKSYEIWSYDKETNTLSSGDNAPSDLTPYLNSTIRFCMTEDPLSYYAITIKNISDPNDPNTYDVDVLYPSNPDDRVFTNMFFPIKQLQVVEETDYNVELTDYTETQKETIFTKTVAGDFSFTIPDNVVELEVEYAGSYGSEAYCNGIAFRFGGYGAIHKDSILCTAGDTISGSVGGIGTAPTQSANGTGGSGFSDGDDAVGYAEMGANWWRAGSGGGSTGFTYDEETYEACGGGGAGAGAINTSATVGGKGGGAYGGASQTQINVGTSLGNSATDPDKIGLNKGVGYIKVVGLKNVNLNSRFILNESGDSLTATGYFAINNDLDPYIDSVMRFFPSNSLLQYVDLFISGKTSDSAYSVSVVRTINIEKIPEDGLSFKFVRNSISGDTTIQAMDNGRYLGTFTSQDSVITFDFDVYNLSYGFPYDKIGVIQDNLPLNELKNIGTVNMYLYDTCSLSIGTSLKTMENIIKYKTTDFYDSTPVMQNGIVKSTLSGVYSDELNIIFSCADGLPFTISALEYTVKYSDMGGD